MIKNYKDNLSFQYLYVRKIRIQYKTFIFVLIRIFFQAIQ